MRYIACPAHPDDWRPLRRKQAAAHTCSQAGVALLLCLTRTRRACVHVQMAECRGQMLKEQKARHALMLRKERLEAEVIRLRGLQAGEAASRRAQARVSLPPSFACLALLSVSAACASCQRVGH